MSQCFKFFLFLNYIVLYIHSLYIFLLLLHLAAIGLKTPSRSIKSLYLLQELYQSRFDLAMWSKKYSETKWSTIQKNLWKLHMPYPLHPEDTLPCSYTNIFGPNSESGLMYHQIWRKVLLEDILLSLDEAGWLSSDKTDSEKVRIFIFVAFFFLSAVYYNNTVI